jgi:muscleblind protein
MVPYKRPAADKSGIPVYQPSATTYQQLMQLQQPFVPVSCEYSSNPSHASTNTIYPNTSTAIPIAHNNNIHHHLILNNNSSINNNNNNSNSTASNNTSNNLLSNNSNNNSKLGNNITSINANLNTSNSNFLTQYVTSANTQYSKANSTVITSTAHSYLNKPQIYQVNHQIQANSNSNSQNNALNAINDQDNNGNNNNNSNIMKNTDNNTSNINSGNENETSDCDNKVTNDDTSNNNLNSNNKTDSKESNNKSSSDSATSLSNNSSIDNLSNSNQYAIATPTSTTTTVTLGNLYKTYNTNAFKPTTTTTSSTVASQSNLTSTATPTQNNLKLDNVQDHLIPTLANPHGQLISNVTQTPQSIIHFSNALMQQHYPHLAAQQNLYADPAQLAKEVAQKNYANALKLAAAAAAQQTTQLSGKPLTAYQNVQALNNKAQVQAQAQAQAAAALYSQQVGQRLSTPMSPSANPLMTLNRPMQNPFQQYMRPQMTPASLTGNPYYPQLLSPQNFLYSGLSQVNPALTAQQSAAAQQQANLASAGYPFTLNAHQAQLNHQALNGLSSTMLSHTQVPPISAAAAATATTTPGSAVVLNPYKKMKTS